MNKYIHGTLTSDDQFPDLLIAYYKSKLHNTCNTQPVLCTYKEATFVYVNVRKY